MKQFQLQQSFLWLCVLSIFLPGSPFDPLSYANEWTFENWLVQFKSTLYAPPADLMINSTTVLPMEAHQNFSWSNFSLTGQMSSIIIFFCGITFARFGLWMADLSVTQIMQENVPENNRNTVFGVQNSLCQFFSVLKDIIVILLPDERTFGFLIIMSVFFVFLGFLHYSWFFFKSSKNPKINSSLKTELEPLKA